MSSHEVAEWGKRQLSDEERSQAKQALWRELGHDSIRTRPGPRGVQIPYLDAGTAVKLANEAFRHDGWCNELLNLKMEYIESRNNRWSCLATAITRVTLPNGCYHDGLGIGSMEGCSSKVDAIDNAMKTAVTDSLKRALRHFGDGLGNNLKVTLTDVPSKSVTVPSFEDCFLAEFRGEHSLVQASPQPKSYVDSHIKPGSLTYSALRRSSDKTRQSSIRSLVISQHNEVALVECPQSTTAPSANMPTKQSSGEASKSVVRLRDLKKAGQQLVRTLSQRLSADNVPDRPDTSSLSVAKYPFKKSK